MKINASALPKLTNAQRRVLEWLGHGWTAYPGAGSTVCVNGARICNVDTMTALEKVGLAVRGEDRGWSATDEGRRVAASL